MVYDQRWKTARRNSFNVLARCNISIWTKSLPPLTDCDNSAAKIANWRHGGSWVEPLPITEKEWQVRHGDQPWYPHVLWPLRWTIAHSTWMVPLQFVIWYKPKTRKYTAKRGFTSIQVVPTHTHSELTLRILLWSASYVQKQSSYYAWQEGVVERPRKPVRSSHPHS